jgi:hypothetical protein
MVDRWRLNNRAASAALFDPLSGENAHAQFLGLNRRAGKE